MKINHNWDHAAISDYLFDCFHREHDNLLLHASADETRRWNLTFVLDYMNLGDNNFGGTVNYNKKRRIFDFIEYSDSHNYAVRVSIASKCYWSAWEHRDYLYRNVPEYYCPDNKLAQWLLTH